MKKLLSVLFCIALVVGFCSVGSAATVLSNEELGDLYAGLDIAVTEEAIENAAVATQANIGVIAAITTAGGQPHARIHGSKIVQSNVAHVHSSRTHGGHH